MKALQLFLFVLFVLTAQLFCWSGESIQNLPEIDENTMRIFFVRHAETMHNANPNMTHSQEGYYRITEKGEKQAKVIGEVLRNSPIVAAFTSETDRTLKTLELSGLAEAHNLEIKQDAAFNRPEAGLKKDGTPTNFRWRIEQWREGHDPRPENGESLSDAVQDTFEQLRHVEKGYGKAVVIVTHGDIIAGVAGSADGYPPWKRWSNFQSNTGSITVIDLEKDGPAALRAFNITPDINE